MNLHSRLRKLEIIEGTNELIPLSPDEEKRLSELLDMQEDDPNYNIIECLGLLCKLYPMSFEERLRITLNERMLANEYIK